jgi:VanZ family protein
MSRNRDRQQIIFYFSVLLVVAWIAFIFHLSSQPASQFNALSRQVTEVIIETIEKVAPETSFNWDLRGLNHFIRKKAHFISYFVLGALVMNALDQKGYRKVPLTLLICVLYAVSDEIHQTFVPGRGGNVIDVVLDSVGSLIGIGLYLVVRSKVTVRLNK